MYTYCAETSPEQHCITDYSNIVFASSKVSMLVTNWLLASVGETMLLFIGLCILGSFVLKINIPCVTFPMRKQHPSVSHRSTFLTLSCK